MSTLQRLTDQGLVKPPRWLPGNVQYETLEEQRRPDRRPHSAVSAEEPGNRPFVTGVGLTPHRRPPTNLLSGLY